MLTAEFQAKVVAGRIEIPAALRDQFQGDVNVILFAKGADQDPSAWPSQNRRRWELIANKVRQGLTDAELQELTLLQQRVDEQLTSVGARPNAKLERWYAQFSQDTLEA
jgi:hypothetical protein